MAMPPPLEPEIEDDKDDVPNGVDLTGVIKKIQNLGISDYIFAIGTGIVAFRDARKRRTERENRE